MKCAVVDCPTESRPVEVRINTYHSHRQDTRSRLTAMIPLCPVHSYVHGYAWTPTTMEYWGAFPRDYREFHGRRVGPL